ncbi:MAG TPA: hypothetical protein VGM30_07310 [Puia sp.]|jgi:hypothetical protein
MNRTILTIFFSLFLFCAGAQTEEKVFAHTDKDCYLAGEILWFKLYTVDAAFHRPLDLSKLAYVEILSGEQRPVLQAKIPLDSGFGNGSFQLPFSLHSGNYILRAYTNWMKNEGPDHYFEKPLTILNTLRNTPPIPSVATPTIPPPYDIQFFPEGGNLVEGLPARIAFRIAGRSGKGLSCKGTLINETGDTLARFHTLRFGMGQFTFTPAKGNKYKALLEPEDHSRLTRELPPAEEKGYTMEMTDAGAGKLQVTVRTNLPDKDIPAELVVHTHHSITMTQKKELTGGEARFLVDKDSLEEGISLFTILGQSTQPGTGQATGQKIPVAERLWFKYAAPLKMELHTDQENYSPRQKVTVDLSTRDAAGQPLVMNSSIAVVLQDSLQSPGQETLPDYLLLTSELKGAIESPAYYFSAESPDRESSMDLLMMIQGWRKFRWTTSQKNTTASFQYPPEYAGLLISGKITDRRTGAPAAGIPAWLSAPGQQFRVAYSVSNRSGDIQWDLGMLYGAHELVVQTAGPAADSFYRVDITSPFADPAGGNNPAPFQRPAVTKDQLLFHSISAQAQNAYQPDRQQHFIQPLLTDTSTFFGRPDKRYLLDDYTRFSTMEEVMREYVKEVRVRINKGNFVFNIQSDQANELFFESTPLVLVDGVPVSDINSIIRFDPLKMKKMEIMTKRYFLGDSLFNGIISYQTYTGDLSGFPLAPNAYILDYEGLQLQREFYSPVYDTRDRQNSRIPDLRNVLYWSPNILTNTQGRQQMSFYTSDAPGRYSVIIQGMTAGGKAGTSTTFFNVQSSSAKTP